MRKGNLLSSLRNGGRHSQSQIVLSPTCFLQVSKVILEDWVLTWVLGCHWDCSARAGAALALHKQLWKHPGTEVHSIYEPSGVLYFFLDTRKSGFAMCEKRQGPCGDWAAPNVMYFASSVSWLCQLLLTRLQFSVSQMSFLWLTNKRFHGVIFAMLTSVINNTVLLPGGKKNKSHEVKQSMDDQQDERWVHTPAHPHTEGLCQIMRYHNIQEFQLKSFCNTSSQHPPRFFSFSGLCEGICETPDRR